MMVSDFILNIFLVHLVIFCHPDHQSHSGEALRRLTTKFDQKGVRYEVLDLYKMGFKSELEAEEIKNMKAREPLAADVQELQAKVKEAEVLYFIHPVWWYGMPARLKGFMDRVFTAGFAFRFKKTNALMMLGANILSWMPGLRYFAQPMAANGFLGDKKAVVIRTFGGPSAGARIFANTEHQLENSVLRFCGLTKIKKIELYAVDTKYNSVEREAKFYRRVEGVVGAFD